MVYRAVKSDRWKFSQTFSKYTSKSISQYCRKGFRLIDTKLNIVIVCTSKPYVEKRKQI